MKVSKNASLGSRASNSRKGTRARLPRRFQPAVEALESRTVPTLNLGFSSLEFFKRGAWDALHETFQFSGTVDSMNSAVIDMANTNPMNVGDTVTVSDGTHTITPDPTIVSINPNVSITLSAPWPSTFPPSATVTVSDVDFESAGQFPVTLLDLPAAATGSTTSTTGTIANTDTNHPFAFGAPATAVITTANTSGFSAGQFVLVTQGSGSSAVSLYSFVDSVSSNSIALDDTWNGSTTMSVKVTALVPSSPEFLTYCWDLQNFLTDWLGPGLGQDAPPPTNTNVFPVTPTLTPTLSSAQKTDGTSAAQRISYLYNTFGTVDISTLSGTDPGTGLPQGTTAQAVGLQVAIWELEYGSSFTNLTVDSQAGNTSVAAQEQMDVTTWANHYLNVSLNKSYTATFLQANGTSTQLGGGDQGMLVVPAINTMQQPATATVGSSIADKATVSGGVNPTGTVTFNLYNNPTASGTPLFTDTEPLSGGMATSKGYTATVTGTDYWVATYNGDSNNTAVTSSPTAEPVTVTPATPAINTSQQPPTAVVGSPIADKATVTGGFNPTGTVTFILYSNPNGTGTPLFTDTEPLSGGMTTSKTYVTTAAGTDYWVATYNGDSNNNSVSSGTGDEPVVISPPPPPPSLLVTKTADAATVTAGQKIGYTVTITNTGAAPVTGLQLSDPLPFGTSTDLNWTIDASKGNPADFQITGSLGSQTLSLSSNFVNTLGDTLAPGQSISVHITSPTTASDAGVGNVNMNGFDITGTPAPSGLSIAPANNYSVLGLNINNLGNLIINSATIAGNVGVGPGETASDLEKAVVSGAVYVDTTGTVSFHSKDFIPQGGFIYNQNLTPAQNAALAASSFAASLPADFNLGNLTTSTTVSATAASRADGVTVVSLSSLNYNSNTLTLNGGANDVFVINDSGDLLFAQSKIVLTGGLTANHVLFNLTGTNAGGHDVTIFKSTSVWNGTLLAPQRNVLYRDPGSWSGEIIGGETLKVYSGAVFTGELSNTATVTANNASTSSATAVITIKSAAQAQVADNSSATADSAGLLGSFADLTTGTLLVYVDNSQDNVTAEEQARIDDAIASVNAGLGQFGVNLVDVTATDTTGGADANIRITIADTSDLGGVPEGILGLEEMGGSITIVAGWNWYTGADPTQIGADQYDFQTTVTHELGHSLGLGGSTDINSPMYESLPTGVARRVMTTNDLTVIEDLEEDPLRAAPVNGNGTPGIREASAQPAGFLAPVFQLASFVPPALQPASAWPLSVPGFELVLPQAPWNNGLLGTAGNSSLPIATVFDSRSSSAAPAAETLFRQDGFDWLDLPEWDQALLAAPAAPTRGPEGQFRPATSFADRVFASPEYQRNDPMLAPVAQANNASNDAGELPTSEPATNAWMEWGNLVESEE